MEGLIFRILRYINNDVQLSFSAITNNINDWMKPHNNLNYMNLGFLKSAYQ